MLPELVCGYGDVGWVYGYSRGLCSLWARLRIRSPLFGARVIRVLRPLFLAPYLECGHYFNGPLHMSVTCSRLVLPEEYRNLAGSGPVFSILRGSTADTCSCQSTRIQRNAWFDSGYIFASVHESLGIPRISCVEVDLGS